MTTEVWKFWEGKTKWPGLCEACGNAIDKDVWYLGKRKLHAACYVEYKKQVRVVPDEAEIPEPTANASKTLSNAPSSASPSEKVSDYQLTSKDLLAALNQIGAEISEVSRAIKAQTEWLSINSVKTLEVK
jgi:hypothetical protein